MIPTAKDLMETRIVSVAPETPLINVHRLFVEEQISGAPVLDELGAVVGVITAADLLRAVAEEHDTVRMEADYFRDTLPYSSPDWSGSPENFQDRLAELRVSDEMSEGVPPSAGAPEVARTLRKAAVHRVFVAEDGRLLGILSAFDLLRVIEDWTED
jgi:CBS domain-containing protein